MTNASVRTTAKNSSSTPGASSNPTVESRAFKTLLLAVLLAGFACTLLAGPQPPARKFVQQYAPTVPVTELLENEAAAVQQPLTNNAATESQSQTALKAKQITP